jgi:hypothetical protein
MAMPGCASVAKARERRVSCDRATGAVGEGIATGGGVTSAGIVSGCAVTVGSGMIVRGAGAAFSRVAIVVDSGAGATIVRSIGTGETTGGGSTGGRTTTSGNAVGTAISEVLGMGGGGTTGGATLGAEVGIDSGSGKRRSRSSRRRTLM